MQLPEVGTEFQSKYRLQEVLGEGGFARVYRAEDAGAKRVVALKILKPHEGAYAAATESRFQREVRVIANLRDPHTVTMFDFGRSPDGLLFMVFEYVPGTDLSKVIEARGRLDENDTVHIMTQVLQSLREAHHEGLLHRDLKPENIRVFEYMGDPLRVTLLDFGIAKPVKAGAEMSAITHSGSLVGTPQYMSPEQLLEKDLTPASDIYSLGLVCYEMLAGEPAVKGNRLADQLQVLGRAEALTLPGELDVSAGLRRIVDRMISRDAATRMQTAEQVLRALDARYAHEQQDISLDETGALAPVGPSGSGSQSVRPNTGSQSVRPTTGPQQPAAIHHGQPGSQTPQYVHAQNTGMNQGAPAPDWSSGLRQRPMFPEEPTAPQSEPIPVRFPHSSGDVSVEEEPDGEIPTWMLGAALLIVLAFLALVLSIGYDIAVPTAPSPSRVPVLPPSLAAPPPAADPGVPASTQGKAAKPDEVTQPAPEPTGCGRDAPFTGEESAIEISEGLEVRYHHAYIPTTYDRSRKHPLLILFHDVQQTGSILDRTGLDELAEELGWVILLPRDDDISPWQDLADIRRTRVAVEDLQRVLCIDESRVFAFGHGAGGRIVERIACRYPAVAATATSSFRPQVGEEHVCVDPKKPIPHMHIAALGDLNGKGCSDERPVSLEAQDERLLSNGGCRRDSKRRWKWHKNGECSTWDCRDAPYVSCRVKGGREWYDTTPRDPLPSMFGTPANECDGEPVPFPHRERIKQFFEEFAPGEEQR